MVDGFTGRLAAFNHGELDPREHEEMRKHVDGCVDCTRRLAADGAVAATLRAGSTPAPPELRDSIMAGVRAAAAAEAAPAPEAPAAPSGPADNVRELVPPTRRRSRRWWAGLAVAAAFVLLLAVVAVTSSVFDSTTSPPVVAPSFQPSPPLAAALDAYRGQQLPVAPDGRGTTAAQRRAVLGDANPEPTLPHLTSAGYGQVALAGKPGIVTEYRAGNQRLAVFRWKGELGPALVRTHAFQPAQLQTTRWGPSQGAWWNDNGSVVCVMGNLDPAAFNQAVEQLRRES
jgi:Putative zinc-finger